MSDITPEILAEAKADGWADKDAWRGPPEAWVDAAEFVRRKHTVLPLLRKENERINTALAETKAALEGLRGNMDEFVKYQQEQTLQKLADQRKQLLAEKREADAAGDDARVVQLEEQLDENAEQRLAAKAPKAAAPAKPAGESPAFEAWRGTNSWFGQDDVKTGLAMGLGREAAKKGLDGKAYFDYIDAGLRKILEPEPAPNKSEGGGPSGRAGGKQTGYDALPAEAKAQCDADAKRFVGPNKLFKDVDAWRANYTKIYFQE